ncbi:MAG TPA: M56 family metallopeptidase [Puia sp.]|jgi:beta-lactamase regulating signal transducer with metallopeptidase domain|nr:M56 family metallopeptidase [Puia sp.]
MHLNIATMPIVPLFLFKLSVCLAIVWCFYQAVLRRLTFYSLNRWYLLGYSLISFLIPLINIGPMLPKWPAGEPVVLQYIPAMGGVAQRTAAGVSSLPSAGLSGWAIILWVLAAGSVLLLVRVIVRWVSLVRLRRNARLIDGHEVKIYQVDKPIIPFSFGNAIYLNQHSHSEQEWADIILHEYVHIRQRHTVDILSSELVSVLNWYNPFAWLIRYSIRQNLEFIADQEVLDNGVERKGYQYHLLKVVGESGYRLANKFNFSSLKKRIVMMNKVRSAKVHLLKLLFLLPLVAVLLVAFRDRYTGLLGSQGPVFVNAAGIVISSPDRKPMEGVVVRDTVTGLQTTTDGNGFYKLHIPVQTNPVKIHLDYTKPGYDTDFRGRNIPDLKETIGILDVGVIHLLNRVRSSEYGIFIAPSFVKVPADPDYADAVQEMKRALKGSDDLNRFMTMKKDHSEIGLFYTTEDRRKEIVIYMDGTIERYGYPGTPGLQELYKKYGEFPGYMATDHPEGHLANPGYLARWAAIGEQAQREFHSTNPNVRAVIFPGDSRVIGVPVSGNPRYYDMDNDAENERAEFERLYGKLPDRVPKAGFNSDDMERKAGWPPHKVVADTVPGGGDSTRRRIRLIGKVGGRPDSTAPLYIVDGKWMPSDWGVGAIPVEMVKSVTVIGPGPAVAAYGERAKRGAVLLSTNDPGHDWSKEQGKEAEAKGMHPMETVQLVEGYTNRPLFLIGGKEVPADTLKTLDPQRIESISVLKDSAAVKSYGEKGKNGVVIIRLKQ